MKSEEGRELQGKPKKQRKSTEKIKTKFGNGRTHAAERSSLEEAWLSASGDNREQPPEGPWQMPAGPAAGGMEEVEGGGVSHVASLSQF